jgi:hypothetical protein
VPSVRRSVVQISFLGGGRNWMAERDCLRRQK